MLHAGGWGAQIPPFFPPPCLPSMLLMCPTNPEVPGEQGDPQVVADRAEGWSKGESGHGGHKCARTHTHASTVTRMGVGSPTCYRLLAEHSSLGVRVPGGNSPRSSTQSVILASHVPSLSLSFLLCEKGGQWPLWFSQLCHCGAFTKLDFTMTQGYHPCFADFDPRPILPLSFQTLRRSKVLLSATWLGLAPPPPPGSSAHSAGRYPLTNPFSGGCSLGN